MTSCFRIVFVLFILMQLFDAHASKDTSGLYMSNLVRIARVTGNSSPGESFPNPNNTAAQYDVGGTDLGIMWDMGGGKVGIFFGDTNGKDFKPFKKGGGGNGRNWRSNVLAFSNDASLDDGLTIDSMVVDKDGNAREIVAGAKAKPKPYQTSIPTGAIHANGKDYVHYMNIYKWDQPGGRWLTNFSSLYESKDKGQTWNRVQQVTFDPQSKFSQVCYAKENGWVYMIGTLAGRGAAGYIARFKEKDITQINKYEYWDGKKWIKNNADAAIPVIEGPMGEASLLYHQKYKRWIIAYIYDFQHDPAPVVKRHAIVYRDAEILTGPWSDIKVLTTSKEYAGLYSPYFHPLKNNGDQLYFTMSLWGPYNVFLMLADIHMK